MSSKWMIMRDGQEYGPYAEEELLNYIEKGQITSQDLAKKEGTTKWQKVTEIQEFSSLFQSAAMQQPPPPPFSPPAGGKGKMTPLKIVGIIGGVIVGGFILLVIIGLMLPEEEQAAQAPAPAETAAPEETPSPAETPETDETAPSEGSTSEQLADMGGGEVEATSEPSSAMVEDPPPPPEGMQVFRAESLGYQIAFPDHWIREAADQNTMIFSGPEGTEEYYTTVTIQNIASDRAGGVHNSTESVSEEVIRQYRETGGDVLARVSGRIEIAGGEYLMTDYSANYFLNGEEFYVWAVVVQRDENVFHQVSYTAPPEFYEMSSDIAQLMRENWYLIW